MSARATAMQLFRAMLKDEHGRPRCGDAAKHLGARVPIDIRPDAAGDVRPGAGGMSVTPDDPARLPPHLRPVALGGKGKLPVFLLETSDLGPDLTYRADPVHPDAHGFVEPARAMALEAYQAGLCETAPRWKEMLP